MNNSEPKNTRSPELNRRLFLKNTGAGALALMAMGIGKGFPVMAGPFEVGEFEKLVPSDKKLTAAWLRLLSERGEPERFSGEELKYIGMPVGGICCGQVYLAGDGQLWHWDIFNKKREGKPDYAGIHYERPMLASKHKGIDLGFTLRTRSEGKASTHSLDSNGFSNILFRGAYPMGFVDYADENCPVQVSLEAFSPFCPLETDDSSLPLTVMRYTVRNESSNLVEVSLASHLTNPILKDSGNNGEATFVNTLRQSKGVTSVQCTVEEILGKKDRQDIAFEDFESGTYENWETEGTAFGTEPVVAANMPKHQSNIEAQGERLVNSHNTGKGEGDRTGDAHTGVLTSRPFTIERSYIHALIGGGGDIEKVSFQLLIGDTVVAQLAGQNKNTLKRETLNVKQYEGQTARLRIVDNHSGSWGNIGVDQIVFSDRSEEKPLPLFERPDFGDMTLAVLEDGEGVFGAANLPAGDTEQRFTNGDKIARTNGDDRPCGSVGKTLSIEPGEQATVSFVIGWRFPNSPPPVEVEPDIAPVDSGHYYAERFTSSRDVVDYLTERYEELYARTHLWHKTWYDSTLPHWLLDRTFVNTSILASRTCMRFEGGRFYGTEGVDCCPGTCTHVWHYAQSIGRVFPDLERITRERVDYGVAFQPSGVIGFRGEHTSEATDGQCGTILRVYREHTMSPNDEFLVQIWPRVKQSIQYLIAKDENDNGVLENRQFNTLDAAWYGPISWISSLYIAALRASVEMALEMGDSRFANECNTLADRGGKWVTENLFDGEYFYQQRDENHPNALGSGIGCHIDQVLGQGWAHQVGLGRVLPKKETESALESLWRYNFTPDVGPYRKMNRPGRWYAMPGEAGLIMTTFPKGGKIEARGANSAGTDVGKYYNESMNGFEYQVAGHMVAEGLVEKGLAITRAIHERYSPLRRNPYNEIECSDHYARSMASHGVFVSVCGFECHGSKGMIGFAPRLSPENFSAPFITAEGWGTFTQKREGRAQTETLHLNYGQLNLKQTTFALPAGKKASSVLVTLDGAVLQADHRMAEDRVEIQLADATTIQTGQMLEVHIQV